MQAEDGQQPGTISHDGVPLPVVSGGRGGRGRERGVKSRCRQIISTFLKEVQNLNEADQLIG